MKVQAFNENWLFGKLTEGEEPQLRSVSLPHDAMIHERRAPDAPGGSGNGYFPGGEYLYRKVFYCPADWEGKAVMLHFGGVYRDAAVSLNGAGLLRHAYGYGGFTVDLSGSVVPGEDNTLEVRVDNSKLPNSRWYSGSGIFRPVELITGNAEHINYRGVKITTLSLQPPRVLVETELTQQEGREGIGNLLQIELLDGERVISRGVGTSVELDVPGAEPWSEDSPRLYTCRAILLADSGKRLDECCQPFGLRTVSWSPQGLLVNGRETLLRGGCIHHDNGILGAATLPQAEERRVRKLRKAGFNAIRCAHNPASEALLEACDKYGMYVMDETWDMWYKHKTKYDYAKDFMDNYQHDIRELVRRDYNHPSVIMYSIGNEVSEPAEERGLELAREMIARFHELDSSRPVTAGINLSIITSFANGKPLYAEEGGRADDSVNKKQGMNSTMFNLMASRVGPMMNMAANSQKADRVTSPVLDALDIAGYNYASGRYRLEGEKHPDRVVVGSETFPQDIWKNWQLVKALPYLIGDFMWVAWDYLGETGIGAWAYTEDAKTFDKPYPWLLADCGAMDILGDPNGELYQAQAAWGQLNGPVIAVRPVKSPAEKLIKSVWRGTNSIPSWSWQGCEGYPAVVEVYSPGESVRLLLGGKQVGKKRLKEGKAVFKLKYAPQELTAIAYDGSGRELLGRQSLFPSVGRPRVSLEPEVLSAKTGEAVFVPVTLAGTNGMRECGADIPLTATVEGGELLAFGSAAPRTEERYDAGSCTTYYGRAMAVVRGNKPGNLVLTVRDGEQERSVVIVIE